MTAMAAITTHSSTLFIFTFLPFIDSTSYYAVRICHLPVYAFIYR